MTDPDDGLGSNDDIHEQIKALVMDAMDGSAPPTPVVWNRLSAVETDRAWRELATWIRWLVSRYQVTLQEIPPCWYLHGGLVEELTALHGAYLVAFDPSQAASAALDWHRSFWDTRIRLKDRVATTGCTIKEHRPGQVQPWVDSTAGVAVPTWHHEFDAYVRREVDDLSSLEDCPPM